MKRGGRPRKIRSRATSGVGGRPFTDTELSELLKLGERYGLDVDDEPAVNEFIEHLEKAFGSYSAAEDALSHQVGVADELFDLGTLLVRARHVLTLVEESAELSNDQLCLTAAAELVQSLQAFPNLVSVEISVMTERTEFLRVKRLLELDLMMVRSWNEHRALFVRSLELLIDVCERVEAPAMFTKRTRQARSLFDDELRHIYLEHLHPLRDLDWRETHREPNDPPPPKSTERFAHGVMQALGVKFESKGVSP